MYRRVAAAFMILLNALTPAFSNACASSCVLGSSSVDIALEVRQNATNAYVGIDANGEIPCHGVPLSPDEGGAGTDDAGSMAAMCAFAAGGAISATVPGMDHAASSPRIDFIQNRNPSFRNLPAEKPPRT
jgi:hypothetical protein